MNNKCKILVSFLLFYTTNLATATDWEMYETKSINLLRYTQKNEQDFNQKIKEICSDPKVTCLDFSSSNLKDNHLPIIFKGLVEREIKSSKDNHHPLKLLDISCEDITNEGLKTFLVLLQKGDNKVYPDVRGTVLKIGSGIELTEEYIKALHKEASSVFSAGLSLVE